VGQTGQDLIISYKAETTLGVVPAVLTGAKQFRLARSPGLKLGRATIASDEVRSDGQSTIIRLGSRSVSGSFTANLSAGGTFDDLIAAALRGTIASGAVLPAVPPVQTSFTFEQYETITGVRKVFTGCRVTGMSLTVAPNGNVMITFPFMGLNMTGPTAGAALFTSPTRTTNASLVGDDSAITLNGTASVILTGIDFALDLHGTMTPVIGSTIAPDVDTSNMTLTGTVRAKRTSIALENAFITEALQALVIGLAEPSPSTASCVFTLPQFKFTDFSTSLGDTGPMIVSLPFTAGYDATLGGMIKYATTA
jgi:hypothetical protein